MNSLRGCLLLTVSLALRAVAQDGDCHLRYSCTEELRASFPENDSIVLCECSAPRDSGAEIRDGNYLRESFDVAYKKGVPEGYLYHGREYSKSTHMYFSVSIDAKGNVVKVHIIDAGSPVGRKTGSKRFLSQFKGKNAGSNLKNEIHGVTGATYSTKAIVRGTAKALECWQALHAKSGNPE